MRWQCWTIFSDFIPALSILNQRGIMVRGHLELYVEAERGDEDGAAVAVVAGVVDVLQAGRDVNAAPDVGCIVGFDDIFAAVVEIAIAEQKAEAAIGEIILVVLLDCI